MGRVTIRFWGSGDAVGSGGRSQACVQVRWGEENFLIDCGASSLPAMKRAGGDPSSIDLIAVSHLHGDHFGGIPFFLIDAQFAGRTRPLTVAGPPGVEGRVKEAQEVFFPGSSQVRRKFPLQFIEMREREPIRWGGLALTGYEVSHPSGAPSYALRIEGAGRAVAYSGDTEWTDALVHAARGADLFICEAYFFEKKVKYHLDYQTLLEHRQELGCRRILLTHMNQDLLGRLGEIDLEGAQDGQEFALEDP